VRGWSSLAPPRRVLADEPTTALDVTVQGQVLDLLLQLRRELGMSILLITHDLGVVADVADRGAVMYAGQIIETGLLTDLFHSPRHPYTEGLLLAVPRNERRAGALPTIPGVVPPPWDWPRGCHFAPRCTYAIDACREAPVALEIDGTGRGHRCVRAEELTLWGVTNSNRPIEVAGYMTESLIDIQNLSISFPGVGGLLPWQRGADVRAVVDAT
jgi:oligopeptide/dipeptide ABC transporter ATP-binding protein